MYLIIVLNQSRSPEFLLNTFLSSTRFFVVDKHTSRYHRYSAIDIVWDPLTPIQDRVVDYDDACNDCYIETEYYFWRHQILEE